MSCGFVEQRSSSRITLLSLPVSEYTVAKTFKHKFTLLIKGKCSRMGRRAMHIGYWWESQKEKDHWVYQSAREVDNIKMDLREMGWDGMDYIDLVQDRDQWRALVNTVMNLRASIKCWDFL
jgi:hypothetical protein